MIPERILRKPSPKKKIYFFLSGLILIILIIVLYTNIAFNVNELTRTINILKDSLNRKNQANELLKIEIERLSSYEMIKETVLYKFNMKFDENALDNNNAMIINKSELE